MAKHVLPFTPLIESLPATIPFVGPETIERRRGEVFRARIGANESAFGISEKAAEAMRKAIYRTSWYADPEGFDIKQAIGEKFSVKSEEICLGAGVDELLGLVVRIVTQKGTPVVTSLGAYPTFNYHVDGYGGALHKVPYRNDHIDLQALADEAHRVKAKLAYLANPDNPMGTWHSAAEVRAFVDALPNDCLLILDEAYIEFAPPGTATPVDTNDARVIHMRTFSKAHGMAGARVGFAIAAQPVVEALNKVRNHFGMNLIALAGAHASFQDEAFIADVVSQVEIGRQDYDELARRLGLETLPSATNFVAIDIGNGHRARAVLKALEERDVFVRMPAVAPLDRCIRASVGAPHEREIFAAAFEEALAAVHNVT